MATANDILKIAKSYIGYTESPANSNMTIFGEMYGYGMNGQPWCMMFVWAVFKKANASNLFFDGQRTASCPTFERWAKRQGNRWVTSNFKPGDIVLYEFDSSTADKGADHVGIVEDVYSGGVIAIEGNTSESGSQDNGGAVLRKRRGNGLIIGAYRPAYTTTAASPANGNAGNESEGFDLANLKTLRVGDYNTQVGTLQILLKARGYNCDYYNSRGQLCNGIDNDFGSATLAAVKRYQKAKKLAVDGIVGRQTWGSLLGV